MPSSDYSNAVGGGLKLKGAGIEKSKKKKKKSKQLSEGSKDAPAKTEVEANSQDALQNALVDEEKNNDVDGELQDTEVKELGRTEAQRRFEERRRKRLEDRLSREGVLTHKEKVQQLNKYLSTLSEHNDMPRIGPG